jgi:hypothetical protein
MQLGWYHDPGTLTETGYELVVLCEKCAETHDAELAQRDGFETKVVSGCELCGWHPDDEEELNELEEAAYARILN